MKTRLLVGAAAVAIALFAGGSLLADDKKPDEKDPKVKGFLPRDFKKLGLTDKQTQEVYKIEAGYRDKIVALQQQIDDLKAAERKDIDGVLTDEQKARLKELLLGEPADKTAPADKDKPAPTPDKPAPPKDK